MPPEPTPITYAFIDLETTGLDPDRHEIWEIGLVVERFEGGHEPKTLYAGRTLYLQPEHLETADAKALEIGQFYDRHPAVAQMISDPSLLARELVRTLNGVYMVGCTIHFDAAFLSRWLRHNGQVPMWNYHLIDATVYAAGRAGLRPPWKSKTVKDHYAQHFGVDFPEGTAHHALDDAMMSRDLYYAALDLGPA